MPDNQTLKPLAEEITERLFEAYDGTLKGDRLAIMQKTEHKGAERDLGGRNRESVLMLVRSVILKHEAALPRSSDTEPPKLRPCEWIVSDDDDEIAHGHFHDWHEYKGNKTALVEFEDGSVDLVNIEGFRFTDRAVTVPA